MRSKARVRQALGAALLLGGALLGTAPGAIAATPGTATEAAQQAEDDVMIPPTLTSAILQGDSVTLRWTPSSTEFMTEWYLVHADGESVLRTAPPATGATVSLSSAGLTGKEEFTVVMVDFAGNVSGPSDGMVPVQQAVPVAP